MDCRELEYPDETFDCIIDKATIDCLLTGQYPHRNVAITLKDCQRVLKTGGVNIALSLGLPLEEHFRKKHLHFDIKVIKEINLIKKAGNNVSAVYTSDLFVLGSSRCCQP